MSEDIETNNKIVYLIYILLFNIIILIKWFNIKVSLETNLNFKYSIFMVWNQ